MNRQSTSGTEMRAITISREYGSGGGEIARRLAEKLQWQLIDHEFVVRIAHMLGVSEYEVEQQDEYSQGTISRILSSMRSIDPALLVDTSNMETSEEGYHQALVSVVQAAAREGHAVIVGRGSQKILENIRAVLHVRIIAPLEKRITYVVQREGLNHDLARDRVLQKDRHRERYLQAHYRANSSDAHLYDLVLNTSVIDLDSAVDLICLALERKANRLSLPEEELGPGAGFGKYPGRPMDFRTPNNPT
ncbi:cytidylate kinase-like family protein [Dictyobacter aurantiacus]|uniref:Cytidylate kinase n=1 Tax=Dictyobacter aurantiacus TaxID=1936993 RepID=A0A401ZE12_9CHLR|nr:cytidylate kinase-like family protein [Dictyobacter aurantiacus]GCE05120.1 cytidylate kinase [Dictyobacter aurantiacus]